MKHPDRLLVTLCVTLVMLMGCAGSGPPTIRYYVVDPVDGRQLGQSRAESLQLLDLKIPQYLDRFQLATRVGSNQLQFAEFHQWGESLRKNLIRSTTRNLSQMLDIADISSPLNRSLSSADYQLQIFIEQFERAGTGEVVLIARYQLGSADGQRSTHLFNSTSGSVRAGDHAGMVAAMRQLLGDLCADIARTLLATEQAA